MSLYLTNPISMTGERGNPPEYKSDNPAHCSRCSVEIDRDDETLHDVITLVRNGRRVPLRQAFESVCNACMERCVCCGQDLDAVHTALYGPAVSVRLWESDGRRKPHHASCAADWLLGDWCDEIGIFESAPASREKIAEIVAEAFRKAVVA